MKMYSIPQLSDPETYKTEKGLFGLARTIAEAKYTDRAEIFAYRDEIVAGKHPQVVFDILMEKLQDQIAAFEKRNDDIEIAKAFVPPTGVTVTVIAESDTLHIATPWDGYDIAPRIKRLGGHWDRDAKVWVVPVSAAASLKRIFANWQKSQAEKAETEAAAKAAKERAKAEQQRQRDAQMVAEREVDRQTRAAQQQVQAKAVASRVQVVLGKHKIGDVLNGKPITGFGKSWTESDLSHGTLYQECDYGRCDNEPVCVNCFKCSKHCGCGTQTTYCYAYFA